MKHWMQTGLLILTIAGMNSSVWAEDCEQGSRFFEQARSEAEDKRWVRAEEILERSVAECNQFNDWYLLGMVRQAQGRFTQASSAFKDARSYAQNDSQVMLAISRYAQTLAQQGQITEPLSILRKAKAMRPKPPVWISTLMLGLDKKRLATPLTVAQVKRGLQGRSAHLLNTGIKPSIDITINFDFDSTQISADTISNVKILADALADQEFSGEKAVIVGHADVRGEDIYNLILSEKRAQAIAAAIVERKPELEGRIAARGLGSNKPLYVGNEDSIHKLNRRIEVYLE